VETYGANAQHQKNRLEKKQPGDKAVVGDFIRDGNKKCERGVEYIDETIPATRKFEFYEERGKYCEKRKT